MDGNQTKESDLLTLSITPKQARALYYCIVKSGMGDSEVEHIKDLRNKLNERCDLP